MTHYRMRWLQTDLGHETTTGERRHIDLDHLMDICRRRNAIWKSENYWSWPVEYDGTTEIREMKREAGVPKRVKS